MKTLKLSKQFGIYPAGSEIEANELLENHLSAGGFLSEPVKKEVKKPKK